MKRNILTSTVLSIALSVFAVAYAQENAEMTKKQGESHPYVEEGRELLDSLHEDVRMEVIDYQKKKAMLYNELSDEAKKVVKRLDQLKHKARRDRMGKKHNRNGEAEGSKDMKDSQRAMQNDQKKEPMFDIYVEDNASGQ